MIQVDNLVKCYGRKRAVDGVSFHVASGEIVGLLGPNGAGKTTTMRILSCFLTPTGGRALVAGHDVLSESMAVRASVGYLPEQVPLYPEMRVQEYLLFRGRLRGLSRAALRGRLAAVAEQCDLGDCMRAPIATLSKGFRQRVGLADCLLHDPHLLILDEPTIGLDPRQVRQFRELVRGLAPEHTVLVASHILSEVEQVCSRVVIMNNGQLIGSGTPAELAASLHENGRVVAVVHAPRRELLRAVQSVAGVETCRCEPLGEWSRLICSCTEPEALSDAIFAMVVANGWRLRELHGSARTLEDSYVALTSGRTEVAA